MWIYWAYGESLLCLAYLEDRESVENAIPSGFENPLESEQKQKRLLRVELQSSKNFGKGSI